MQITKKNFVSYVLLNILTLGIYSMVVSSQVNNEINAICKGDKEEPKSYAVAFIIRAIAPLTGLFLGFIVGLIAVSGSVGALDSLLYGVIFDGYLSAMSSVGFATVLICATYGCILFSIVGLIFSSIYHKYWWYKQANRLKLNAGRYGLTVKEGGIDNILMRTAGEILFIPVTVVIVGLALVAPALLIWLVSYIESVSTMLVLVSIILFAVVGILCVFGGELSTGSLFSTYFVFKNLNRFADVYRNGAEPFDPMAYEYYPSIENKYPNFLPAMVNGAPVQAAPVETDEKVLDNGNVFATSGRLIGVAGSCAGYDFELVSGEEIVIGKDAKMSMVVIDPIYKDVSRKHLGVCYDIIRNQYRVVDYSSNGTWANGIKLNPGQEVYLPGGTELKLANGKNIFRLG